MIITLNGIGLAAELSSKPLTGIDTVRAACRVRAHNLALLANSTSVSVAALEMFVHQGNKLGTDHIRTLARALFGDGVTFDSHRNALVEVEKAPS
jgi:hypothetical protein